MPRSTSHSFPSFALALRFWIKLGLISFGGPAGQIAIMHKELVERKQWMDERHFLNGLNFCMLLPGPEAQQLATYLGWRLHGLWGGLAAGSLFVLPSALIIFALSWLYIAGDSLPWVGAVFYGVLGAVIAIILDAVLRIGGKALRTHSLILLATLAFVAIFFFNLSFVLIVLGAGILGLVGHRLLPRQFPSPQKSFRRWISCGECGGQAAAGSSPDYGENLPSSSANFGPLVDPGGFSGLHTRLEQHARATRAFL
jgi:chromate transporter